MLLLTYHNYFLIHIGRKASHVLGWSFIINYWHYCGILSQNTINPYRTYPISWMHVFLSYDDSPSLTRITPPMTLWKKLPSGPSAPGS